MNILEAGHSLALAAERVDAAIQLKRNRKAELMQTYEALISASETVTQRLKNAMSSELKAYEAEMTELEAIKGGDKPEPEKAEG